MQAVVIHRYGGPDVMSLEERPEPAVGPRDVLIDVRAASLNPLDFKVRGKKAWPALRPKFPIGLGCDVAGVVREVGAEVTAFVAGDEVYARLEKERMGALAERVAADHAVVAKRPTTVSFAQAASVPLAGLTAVQALRESAAAQPGQRVLIHAGAGGVGTLAIQIAKRLGLHVLTTTSGKNAAFVRELGADDVIDYTTEDVAARARGVDIVLDTLGDASEVQSLSIVKPGGVVVGVSGMPDAAFAATRLPWFARPVVWMRTRARRRAIAATGARFAYLFMRPEGAQLAELAAWIDGGTLRPVIHQSYPLAGFAEAFAELERGRARGKIVVTID